MTVEEYLTKIATDGRAAVDILRKGLKSVIRQKGTARGDVNAALTTTHSKLIKHKQIGPKVKEYVKGATKSKVLGDKTISIKKNPDPKTFIQSKERGKASIKELKAAARGMTGLHEGAERIASKRVPRNPNASKHGHHSITEVIGRAEHNTIRSLGKDGKLPEIRNSMKKLRGKHEAKDLERLTPANKGGVKVRYGDPDSPRINKSLALRMSAKEHGVSAKMSSSDIKKALKKKQKEWSKKVDASAKKKFQ